MFSLRTCIVFFSFLLIFSVALAQQRQDYQPEWDEVVKNSPPIEGSLFYLLPNPCRLFSLEGTTQGEPVALTVRGGDLTRQGGSSTGCKIPENASAVMIQVQMESLIDIPVRVKLWSADRPEPVEAVLRSNNGQSDSTMVVVSIDSFSGANGGLFQITTSDWTTIEGQVVGYFRKSDVGVVNVNGEISYYTESTSTSSNDFFGHEAGLSSTGPVPAGNSFFGFYSGRSNISSFNAFFGAYSGRNNTEGAGNSFFGHGSGSNNGTGDRNSYFGYNSAFFLLGGFGNAFFGYESGFGTEFASTGSNNSLFGYQSGYSLETGQDNTFSGYRSGYENTDGNRGAFFGYAAGDSNTVEDNNTFVGAYSDFNPGKDPKINPVTNATAIGYRAFVSKSNSMVLGSINGVNDATASVSVGIGTTAPDSPLHVASASQLARVILAEHTGSETPRNMMLLKNNGVTQFLLEDSSPDGDRWQFGNTDNGLNISLQGSGSQEFLIENDGDVWINNGTVMVTSYRASKENFQNLNTEEILRRVADLPLSDWNYKKDKDTVRHIGPVSEDFYEVFGYGEDNQHIAPNDLAGVAIAAAKGLHRKNQELKMELETLKQELAEIRALVSK
jgi:hypothetical protein